MRVYEQSPLQVKEVDNFKLMKTPGQLGNYHDYSDCTDTNVRTQLDYRDATFAPVRLVLPLRTPCSNFAARTGPLLASPFQIFINLKFETARLAGSFSTVHADAILAARHSVASKWYSGGLRRNKSVERL